VPLFCGAAERMVKTIAVELVSSATFDVHLNELENGDELTTKIIKTSNM
jgi:hypothetical protein